MATQEDVERKRAEALEVAGQQFDRMDSLRKGFVTREDIVALRTAQAAASNIEFSNNEVDSFITDFDSTGDGTVTRNEFINKFGVMFDQMLTSH